MTPIVVDPASPGRRERKKLETRAALVEAALELFLERGLDGVTVEDIADAVDVSTRTFHRYFTSKEDVLFADGDDRLDQFVAALRDRPVDEPLLDSLRAATREMTERFVATEENERQRLRLIRSTPALRARNLQHTDQWSQVVAEQAAARLGQAITDPVPVLLGACAVAAFRTALDQWLVNPDVDYRSEVDRCFDVLGDLRTAVTPRARDARGDDATCVHRD